MVYYLLFKSLSCYVQFLHRLTFQTPIVLLNLRSLMSYSLPAFGPRYCVSALYSNPFRTKTMGT